MRNDRLGHALRIVHNAHNSVLTAKLFYIFMNGTEGPFSLSRKSSKYRSSDLEIEVKVIFTRAAPIYRPSRYIGRLSAFLPLIGSADMGFCHIGIGRLYRPFRYIGSRRYWRAHTSHYRATLKCHYTPTSAHIQSSHPPLAVTFI